MIPQNEVNEKYHEIFGHDWGTMIVSLGLNDVFRSNWFLGLLAMAGVNLAACSVQRWKALAVRPGVFISHAAILLIFAGGIVRGLFSQHGFLPLETGQRQNSFFLDNGKASMLPFIVELKDFRVRYWQPEKHKIYAFRESDGLYEELEVEIGKESHFNPMGITIKLTRFYPNFIITDRGPSNRDEVRENPALELLIQNGNRAPASKRPSGTKGKDWERRLLFAKFPDFLGENNGSGIRLSYENVFGIIRQFESDLAIYQGGSKVLEKKIEVNSPMSFQGFRLYQSGYDPKNPRFSSIQVSMDPSVPLIYSGFGLLFLGLGWAFVSHPGRVALLDRDRSFREIFI